MNDEIVTTFVLVACDAGPPLNCSFLLLGIPNLQAGWILHGCQLFGNAIESPCGIDLAGPISEQCAVRHR
jgi:hypothetical protein